MVVRESPLEDFFETERGRPGAFGRDVRLARIRAWLTGHFPEDVSIGAAARVVGLNPKYFSRYFRMKTGVRYSSWVNAVRIDRAVELLRRNDLGVIAVASEVGFRDLRTFERAFKKHVGVTARRYRNAVRQDAGSPGNPRSRPSSGSPAHKIDRWSRESTPESSPVSG